MQDERNWSEICQKIFEEKKQKTMSSLGKILDMFCQETWHCTLYPSGSAAGSPKFYEIYRGFKIQKEKFIRLIKDEEIINDPEFQEWYKKRKK